MAIAVGRGTSAGMRSLLAVVLILAATLAAQIPTRVAGSAGQPRDLRAIWVLQADSQLLMYDTVRFRASGQAYRLPAEARRRPEAISISRGGTVLYGYEKDVRTPLRRFWSSNSLASEFIVGSWDRKPVSKGAYAILQATPTIYFSGSDERLYWFEYREQRLSRWVDLSRDASFLAWTTDLQGNDPQQVAQFTFPACKCETGLCSQTCLEASAWAPPVGVDDFFYVTRWVNGRMGPDYLESAVYQSTDGNWTSRTLSHPVQQFLDAADHGNVFVEALGSLLDRDNIISVVRGDTSTTIFDERRRFKNNNYDVRFFIANVVIAPDLDRVAYTLFATQFPGDEISLGPEGRANTDELNSIKRTLPELPRVEVVGLAVPDKPMLSLPQTELIGWLDGQHILVFKNGELLQVDASSGKTKSTGIKADAAMFVFLR